MNRNMIIPATIAAGLHAMLLGFKPSAKLPVTVHPPAERPPISVFQKIEVCDLPIDPFNSEDTREKPATPPLPQLEELPHATLIDLDRISIVRAPMPPIEGILVDSIPADWRPGGPDGGDLPGVLDGLQLDNHPRALVRTSPNRPLGLNDTDAHVTVEFIVGKDGRVLNAHVVTSSNRLLEEPCLRAVRMWRFEPGVKRNLPVAFRMSQDFLFNTHD